jgi:hypothetical protein
MKLYGDRAWTDARAAFSKLAKARPSDAAARLMVKRCGRFVRKPPPDDWDWAEYYDTK